MTRFFCRSGGTQLVRRQCSRQAREVFVLDGRSIRIADLATHMINWPLSVRDEKNPGETLKSASRTAAWGKTVRRTFRGEDTMDTAHPRLAWPRAVPRWKALKPQTDRLCGIRSRAADGVPLPPQRARRTCEVRLEIRGCRTTRSAISASPPRCALSSRLAASSAAGDKTGEASLSTANRIVQLRQWRPASVLP